MQHFDALFLQKKSFYLHLIICHFSLSNLICNFRQNSFKKCNDIADTNYTDYTNKYKAFLSFV